MRGNLFCSCVHKLSTIYTSFSVTLEEEILHPYCLLRNELHLERLKKSVHSFGAIITFQQAKRVFFFFFNQHRNLPEFMCMQKIKGV